MPVLRDTASKDLYNLERFVRAQDPEYSEVCSELSSGRKDGHWMWYVFPQLRGLGKSQMSTEFGISCLEEAKAYLNHPVLGQRLIECTNLVLRVKGKSATEIFGATDEMKFRSSMTLFAAAESSFRLVFEIALQRYFDGAPDRLTLSRLKSSPSSA